MERFGSLPGIRNNVNTPRRKLSASPNVHSSKVQVSGTIRTALAFETTGYPGTLGYSDSACNYGHGVNLEEISAVTRRFRVERNARKTCSSDQPTGGCSIIQLAYISEAEPI